MNGRFFGSRALSAAASYGAGLALALAIAAMVLR